MSTKATAPCDERRKRNREVRRLRSSLSAAAVAAARFERTSKSCRSGVVGACVSCEVPSHAAASSSATCAGT
eukprot:7382079-Prymnesium_polylepis.1